MALYFVKHTGDGLDASTDPGTSANWSGAYATALAASNVATIAGDIIICSHLHYETASDFDLLLYISNGVTIISVSDTDTSVELKGAHIERTGSRDIRLLNAVAGVSASIRGLVLTASTDKILICTFSEQRAVVVNCTFNPGSTTDSMTLATADGCYVEVYDSIFNFSEYRTKILLAGGSRAILKNCTTTGIAVTESIFDNLSGAGGRSLQLINCDFTSVGALQITDYLATSNNDTTHIIVSNSLLASGATLASTTVLQKGSQVIARSLGVGSSSDANHYFEEIHWEGTLSEDTSIYRDAGATYDGINNFSAELISNANTSYSYPLKFALSNFYIDTSDYVTDITFTAHFAVDGATTVLNSDEFGIIIEYKDGADNALGVVVDTKPGIGASGVAPTTETSLWTIDATNKQMSISKTVTIGTLTGNIATGAVKVGVYLAKASQTVYVDCKVEIS